MRFQFILFLIILLIILFVIIVLLIKKSKIWKKLKNFLFPFNISKYKFLEKKWAHRLLKVIFLIVLLFNLWFFFIHFTNNRENLQSRCRQNNYSIEQDNRDEVYKYCDTKYPITIWFYAIYSILITLIINYILQIIYFKIIIYIIYDKN